MAYLSVEGRPKMCALEYDELTELSGPGVLL